MTREEAEKKVCHATLGKATHLQCRTDRCMAWIDTGKDYGYCGLVTGGMLEALIDQIGRCF